MRRFGKTLLLCGVALLLMTSSARAQSLSPSFSVRAKDGGDGDLRVGFSETGLKSEVGGLVFYTITGQAACAPAAPDVSPVGTAFSLTVDTNGHTSAILPVEEPIACEGAGGKSVVYSNMQICDTTHGVCKDF